jgi:hypothetical protein
MPGHRSVQRTSSTTSKKHSARKSSRRQRRGRKNRRPTAARASRQRASRHTTPLFKQSIKKWVETVFRGRAHHKQVMSLVMVTVGVAHAAVLGVAAVGTAIARAFGKVPKHGIKQFDRFLSNAKHELVHIWEALVPIMVGPRPRIEVAMDWTCFDEDDHWTLSLSLVTRGRRTIPLVWQTIKKSEVNGNQKFFERLLLLALYAVIPRKVKVVVVADRGFGDVRQYDFIRAEIGWDFVIRYRKDIHVRYHGQMTPSSALVPTRRQVRIIRRTVLTKRKAGPYTVVLCQATGMKAPWCLATSLVETSPREVVRIYGHRFQCEETFRDLKDRRYGYGLRFTRVKSSSRRDRCILAFVLAYVVQTVLGVLSERLGLDRQLRANTESRRTHSLFRQGRSLLGELESHVFDALAACLRSAIKMLLSKGLLEVIP